MCGKPPIGLFVTGVDTGVGKTYVAVQIIRSLVARGVRVGVYKPVASGCRRSGDALVSGDAAELWKAAGQPGELSAVCPQCFAAPLAPHLAARAEGREVATDLLRSGLDYWRRRSDVVVVEGAGGLMSPVSDEEYVADLAYDFGYPLVVTAANKLGAINQTLQTLIAALTFREGIEVAGIVLNDVLPPSAADASAAFNREELAARCTPPILAQLTWLATAFDVDVDWLAVANGGGPRPG